MSGKPALKMELDLLLRTRPGWVVGTSVALPLIAGWLLSLGNHAIANTNAALVLVLLVVAAAATGMRAAGIASALAAAAGFDFFLTAPFRTFAIHSSADLATAVLLLGVGAAVSEIAIWGRRQQARASREQGYLDGLLSTAAAVAAGQASRAQLVDLVGKQLRTLLQIDGCTFDPVMQSGLPALTGDGGLIRNGRTVDVRRRGLPTDTAFVIPVRFAGTVHGHFVLTASTRVVRPTSGQLRVAVMLADQVGGALSTTLPAPAASLTGPLTAHYPG